MKENNSSRIESLEIKKLDKYTENIMLNEILPEIKIDPRDILTIGLLASKLEGVKDMNNVEKVFARGREYIKRELLNKYILKLLSMTKVRIEDEPITLIEIIKEVTNAPQDFSINRIKVKSAYERTKEEREYLTDYNKLEKRMKKLHTKQISKSNKLYFSETYHKSMIFYIKELYYKDENYNKKFFKKLRKGKEIDAEDYEELENFCIGVLCKYRALTKNEATLLFRYLNKPLYYNFYLDSLEDKEKEETLEIVNRIDYLLEEIMESIIKEFIDDEFIDEELRIIERKITENKIYEKRKEIYKLDKRGDLRSKEEWERLRRENFKAEQKIQKEAEQEMQLKCERELEIIEKMFS